MASRSLLLRLLSRLWYEVYAHGPWRGGVPIWYLWMYRRREKKWRR